MKLVKSLVFVMIGIVAYSQNTATASGNWNNCPTWNNPTAIINNSTPPQGDKTVNAGVSVTANGGYYSSVINLTNNTSEVVFSDTSNSVSFTGSGTDITCSTVVLTCGSASINTNRIFSAAPLNTGVTITLPYTGGNGTSYAAGSPISSTGILGLTATLQAGTLAMGAGNLTYSVTGTPNGVGTANFILTFGSQTCSFNVTVNDNVCQNKLVSINPCSQVSGATLNDNGATTGTEYDWTSGTAQGFTTNTRALIQFDNRCWYRYNNDRNVATNAYYNNAGAEPFANAGRLYSWTGAMNGSTAERAQGSCAAGWHVPSDCEWMSLEASVGMPISEQLSGGSRGDTPWNSGTKLLVGGTSGFDAVFGGVSFNSGSSYQDLNTRGYYWSSTVDPSNPTQFTRYRYFLNGGAFVQRAISFQSTDRNSVRCAFDGPSLVLTCGSASINGSLVAGTTYSGTTRQVTVPYTSGNAKPYLTGAGISSTGVGGLTATLVPGTLASGAGNIVFNITGTPANAGTATFLLNFYGLICTFNVTVN